MHGKTEFKQGIIKTKINKPSLIPSQIKSEDGGAEELKKKIFAEKLEKLSEMDKKAISILCALSLAPNAKEFIHASVIIAMTNSDNKEQINEEQIVASFIKLGVETAREEDKIFFKLTNRQIVEIEKIYESSKISLIIGKYLKNSWNRRKKNT